MSNPKKLEQLRSRVGNHRKAIQKLISEIEIAYNTCASVEAKATLLDQFIHVKRHMDKEHQNAMLQRDH